MSERMEAVCKENYLLNRRFVLLTSVHSSPRFNSLESGLCLGEVKAHLPHCPAMDHCRMYPPNPTMRLQKRPAAVPQLWEVLTNQNMHTKSLVGPYLARKAPLKPELKRVARVFI